MAFKILIALALVSLVSASEIHLNVVPPPPGVKLASPSGVSPPVVVADVKVEAPGVPVPEVVKKADSSEPNAAVVQKAKSSLDSQEGVVKLYRHDMGAGVYRTELGELVRMYRVERAKRMRSSAATPAAMMRREGMMGNEGPRERLFGLGGGDWLNNWGGYSGYGGGYPYSSAYSYSNLGGGYPYSYSPYSYSGYGGYPSWYSLY